MLGTCMIVFFYLIGTPPRIDGKTVRFDILQKQVGDDPPTPFSFLNETKNIKVWKNRSLVCVHVYNIIVALIYYGMQMSSEQWVTGNCFT